MTGKYMEYVIYTVLLICCGIGWILVLFRRKGEMDISRTLVGTAAVVLKRMWRRLPKRDWLTAQIKERQYRIRQPALELEIYKSSILLKNLSLAEQDRPFSADYMIEQLMEHTKRLNPVYSQMLTLYRGGKDREAFALLENCCTSRSARNFSMILSKLDRISPGELTEQMEVFQEMMGQQRMTAEMKLVQRNSVIIMALAAGTMFVMMIDFTVVVVFMHTITLLESVF